MLPRSATQFARRRMDRSLGGRAATVMRVYVVGPALSIRRSSARPGAACAPARGGALRLVEQAAGMDAADVAHERRMDAVAEQCLDARRHARRLCGPNRDRVVLLLARPRLAVLVREAEARLRAAVRAAAVDERSEEDD